MQILPTKDYFPMKRDMELIRQILLFIENYSQMDGTTKFMYESLADMGFPAIGHDELAYHLALLIRENMVDGAVTQAVPLQVIRGLTWSGHEFLDNIKNEDIWEETKRRVAQGAQAISLAAVAKIAEALILKKLGVHS